jgi:hypothetical protein
MATQRPPPITAYIDDTLNLAGPGKDDQHNETNILVRETARFQAMQHLDAIKRMLDGSAFKA